MILMQLLGSNLARPMAGLPALKKLDVRIKTHPDLPIIPILPAVLEQFLGESYNAFHGGHFVGLRSVRLTAGANDLVSPGVCGGFAGDLLDSSISSLRQTG